MLSWHFEADPNERFIRDLFELRRFVEPSAARLAAQRRTSADIARIEAAYRGMVDNPPYAEATIRADLAFHEAIFSAAQNAALQCLASAVIATLQWSLLLKTGDEVAYVESLPDHEHVLLAIIDRDGDLASARMAGLVIDSLNTTLASIGTHNATETGKIMRIKHTK